MKCGACQKDCRKTQLAHVAEAGGVRRARVCGACFGGAIHIVPAITSVTRGVAEKDAERKSAKQVLRPAIKRLGGIVAGYRRSGDAAMTAHADGIEAAIDVLESGDFEE